MQTHEEMSELKQTWTDAAAYVRIGSDGNLPYSGCLFTDYEISIHNIPAGKDYVKE